MQPESLQDIQERIIAATAHVLRPFFAFNQHDSLLYWPFLLSTLVISLLAFALARGPFKPGLFGAYRREYFNRAIWGHPSAKADYRFYLVNAILFPLLFGPLVLSGAWVARRIAGGLDSLFGAGGFVADGVVLTIAYTVLFFLAYDFGRYVGHYVQHRFDVLWHFHKVHHSAEVLTPFTNFRAHPVDLICMHTVPALLTGVVDGLFAYATGAKAGLYLFFGLHVLVFAYNLVANLRHSPVWLSYGPWLSRYLISPAQHQIHHSTTPKHFGRNIGFALAIWDRLSGTLYVPVEREHFRLGLGDGSEPAFHGVWRMYWQPVRELLGGSAPAARPATSPAAADNPGARPG